jgi:uncharacterized protein YjgD (DUF1641 family)
VLIKYKLGIISKSVSFIEDAWAIHTVRVLKDIMNHEGKIDLKRINNAITSPMTACAQFAKFNDSNAKMSILKI